MMARFVTVKTMRFRLTCHSNITKTITFAAVRSDLEINNFRNGIYPVFAEVGDLGCVTAAEQRNSSD